jgi:hypothetical protein
MGCPDFLIIQDLARQSMVAVNPLSLGRKEDVDLVSF